MSFYEQFFNEGLEFKEVKNGEMMVSSVAHLDIIACDKTELSMSTSDQVRDKDPFKNILKSQSYREAYGIKEKMRKDTTICSKFTAYGPASIWTTSGRDHGIYGLSQQFVTDTGGLNDLALHDMIMKVIPSNDLTRARVNRMINVYLENSFYDNATPLLAVIYQDLWVLRFTRLNNSNEREITFPASFFDKKDTQFQVLDKVRKAFSEGTDRIGFFDKDDDFYTWAERICEWLKKEVPNPTIVDKDGRAQPNKAYENSRITFSYKYWSCYEYDDGHSKSGKTFGTEFGFVNGKFKVPGDIGLARISGNTILTESGMWDAMNDDAIDARSKASGHINCDNLSKTEVMMLEKYLRGNKRKTPFLVDQTIELCSTDDTIYAYNATEIPSGEAKYSEKEVCSLLRKLIANHKWYEDARSAYQGMMHWISQPSTETVESHWWVTMPRRLNLPRMGLSRAMFPQLTAGDGVQITKQALEESQRLTSGSLSHAMLSGMANTLWMWGEYMTTYNHTSMVSMVQHIEDGLDNNVSSMTRVLAVTSAITGMVVPKPCYSSVFTSFLSGMGNELSRTTKFGVIDTTHIEKYGYSRSGKDVIFNAVVAPGCVALVVGLNGSLVSNTPLAATFSVEAPSLQTSMRGADQYKMSFMNLWAAGVVARWQGYDLSYMVHNKADVYVMYAANDVSIASPPIFLNTDENAGLYTIRDANERKKVFGSNIVRSWNITKVFSWSRSKASAHESCDRNAFLAGKTSSMMRFSTSVVVSDNVELHYISALSANYDSEQGGFQLTLQRTAIPLPVNVESYQSSEPLDHGIPEVTEETTTGT